MTGVIVGIDTDVDFETAVRLVLALEEKFPGTRFAVVPGAASIAFEFDAEVQS